MFTLFFAPMYREPLSVSGTEPVSLADAKAHARVEHSDDGAEILQFITDARELAEDWTKRRFVTHQFKVTLDSGELCDPLPLEVATQISAVSLFQGFDPDNTTVTPFVLDTDFRIQNNKLIQISGGLIGSTSVREFGAYEITYTATPNAIHIAKAALAIKLWLTHWYENREEASMEEILKNIPAGAKAKLASLKKWVF